MKESEGSNLTQTEESLVFPGKDILELQPMEGYVTRAGPRASFLSLSHQVLAQKKCLSCLLLGSVLGRNSHKMAATFLSPRT